MHEFPSMVALLSLTLNKVFCGGVIISERFILTGAHCFNDPTYSDLNNIAAFVGEHDLSVSNETIYTESYELEYFVRHERYEPESYFQDYDIAIVKTRMPIAFNLAVGPACLPFNSPHHAFDDRYVHAIGFGYLTYFDPEQATVLQKVALKILSSDKCQDSQINDSKMCTYEQQRDSCVSDSGGPLILNVKGRQFAVGLISYGIGCGSAYPSINTRLTSYLPWITSQLADVRLCQK
jgi:secreted trypsin-like serine protease